ncbi:hypothetical protein KBD08_01290 [Candidatus Babeliales bacterium]|nr:hypothetical protein [Candidatus Babeliales bacterium]
MFTKMKRHTPLALSFLHILFTSSFAYTAQNQEDAYPTFRYNMTTQNTPEECAIIARLTKKRTDTFIAYVMNLTKEHANDLVPNFPFARTPLEVLVYHNTGPSSRWDISLSTEQYETMLNRLLELGSDPNQCSSWLLHEVACQNNYENFKKILDKITPEKFDTNILSVMFNFCMGQNLQDTQDTEKILTALIERGAHTDFSISQLYHPTTKWHLHDTMSHLCNAKPTNDLKE